MVRGVIAQQDERIVLNAEVMPRCSWRRLCHHHIPGHIHHRHPNLRTQVVSIQYNCAGATITTRDGRVAHARVVISTLPLGVLQAALFLMLLASPSAS